MQEPTNLYLKAYCLNQDENYLLFIG